jgi:hypothetical protein
MIPILESHENNGCKWRRGRVIQRNGGDLEGVGWTKDIDLVVFKTYMYLSCEKTAFNNKILFGLFKKESTCIEVCSDDTFRHAVM